jgi:hypothetical protein
MSFGSFIYMYLIYILWYVVIMEMWTKIEMYDQKIEIIWLMFPQHVSALAQHAHWPKPDGRKYLS